MSEVTESWPINWAVLAQTAGPSAAKLLPQLIPLYLEEADPLLELLTEALQTNNATQYEQAAHKLKGNSASMGVMTLAELADELEKAGKQGNLVATQVASLAAEYDRVKQALTAILQERE